MAHNVFICHSSQDKQVADAACAALEAQRIPCWIAPRDILAGEEYGKSIVDALASCQIVLLVFSAHANGSPQVRREIERAVSKGKIIVPFRIEDVLPSDAMEFALSNTHWLDALTPPMERYLLQLCDTIARLIQKHTVAEAPLWKPQEAAEEEAERKAREAEEARVREAEERRAREAREAEQARLRDAAESEAQKEAERKALEAKQAWIREAAEPSELNEIRRKAGGAEPANGGAKATTKPTVGSAPRVVAPRTAKAEIEESKPGWRRVPIWGWAGLGAVLLAGALAAAFIRPAQKPDLHAQADALYNQKRFGEAAQLYNQSCASGNAGACVQLGYQYLYGQGVQSAQSDYQAEALFSKACDSGYALGCASLGDRQFVDQNYSQAVVSDSKACDGGSADGCGYLGELYERGMGVAQNYPRAAALFSKACDGGSGFGCGQLGGLYRRGLGVAKDPDKARQLLTKGCNMGSQWGCDRLKEMH